MSWLVYVISNLAYKLWLKQIPELTKDVIFEQKTLHHLLVKTKIIQCLEHEAFYLIFGTEIKHIY
jgi:hypothetical protein